MHISEVTYCYHTFSVYICLAMNIHHLYCVLNIYGNASLKPILKDGSSDDIGFVMILSHFAAVPPPPPFHPNLPLCIFR